MEDSPLRLAVSTAFSLEYTENPCFATDDVSLAAEFEALLVQEADKENRPPAACLLRACSDSAASGVQFQRVSSKRAPLGDITVRRKATGPRDSSAKADAKAAARETKASAALSPVPHNTAHYKVVTKTEVAVASARPRPMVSFR